MKPYMQVSHELRTSSIRSATMIAPYASIPDHYYSLELVNIRSIITHHLIVALK